MFNNNFNRVGFIKYRSTDVHVDSISKGTTTFLMVRIIEACPTNQKINLEFIKYNAGNWHYYYGFKFWLAKDTLQMFISSNQGKMDYRVLNRMTGNSGIQRVR